jgi:diadenylate cyclase
MMSPGLRWQSVVDFAVLVAAIYVVLRWSREARALRVTLGILALEAGALIGRQFDLTITVWVLHSATVVAAVILIVLFQPELRHAVKRLEIVLARPKQRGVLAEPLAEVIVAAFSLAHANRGALIVLTRQDPVSELLTGGVPLGGQVSAEILEAIFRKVSPVHDGATVIEGDRITRVGALLPLSQNDDLPRNWGTRHRAGLGLAERTDAVIVVASEERGELTLMHEATFDAVRTVDELAARLKNLFASEPARGPSPTVRPSNRLLQATALGLALVIWGATFLVRGSEIRVQSAPIEFTGIAPGLTLVDQSVSFVQMRLRGSTWALDSTNAVRFAARADLRELGEGVHTVDIVGPSAALPRGVELDELSPQRITVRLVSTPTGGAHANDRR